MEVANVGGGLSGLLAHEEELRVDEAEGVDDHLALDRLNRVDHDGHAPRVELLKALLGLNINPRQPAPESRVRVVPPNDNLWSIIINGGRGSAKRGGWQEGEVREGREGVGVHTCRSA